MSGLPSQDVRLEGKLIETWSGKIFELKGVLTSVSLKKGNVAIVRDIITEVAQKHGFSLDKPYFTMSVYELENGDTHHVYAPSDQPGPGFVELDGALKLFYGTNNV